MPGKRRATVRPSPGDANGTFDLRAELVAIVRDAKSPTMGKMRALELLHRLDVEEENKRERARMGL